jgi:hypothetical protein
LKIDVYFFLNLFLELSDFSCFLIDPPCDLRAGRQQRPAPIQLSPPSASFLASHIKDPRATAAWREQARANVEVRVSAGERPLNALHAEYAARAESFGIDRQRVQLADGRRLFYSLHPDIDDSKLRGVIFFHTGTIEGPDGCGLPGHVDDKLVFGDGPPTTHLNFTELEQANRMPHGPSLKELQEAFLFCNVLPVAHKTADGNYEKGQKKAEKTEIGATMRDVMWALTLAHPAKQPANIRVVITRFAPARDVLQPAACATTISTTSFFGPLRFTLYAIHSAGKARVGQPRAFSRRVTSSI